MTQEIICISGWGQKFDSLEFIFKKSDFAPFFVEKNDLLPKDSVDKNQSSILDNQGLNFNIQSLDYSKFSDFQGVVNVAKSYNLNSDIIVGWSLGGQLALRLIAKKIFKPKLLVLIAPPFMMIKDRRVQAGMALDTFNQFRSNFATAPNQTLKKFSILTAMNDRNATQIADSLDISDHNFYQFLFWLDELKRFSCFDLDFTEMPRTVYFHGAGDMIVHVSQAQYFANHIKNIRLEIFKNCGHAPHLSDINKMRKILAEEIMNLVIT